MQIFFSDDLALSKFLAGNERHPHDSRD